jgi:hypothetical protein
VNRATVVVVVGATVVETGTVVVGAGEAQDQSLGRDGGGAQPRSHTEGAGEQRRVLGRRADAVEDDAVEGADVPEAVGQLVGEVVVGAGVAHLGDGGIDDQHRCHPHGEADRHHRQEGQAEAAPREPPRPAPTCDRGPHGRRS